MLIILSKLAQVEVEVEVGGLDEPQCEGIGLDFFFAITISVWC